MKLRNVLAALVFPALLFGAGGCFTGVESTPRINESDVRRQQAGGVTPEQMFLSDLRPVPPRQWTGARRWLVAGERIPLIFSPKSDNPDGLPGHTISFGGISPANSLTGNDAGEIMFIADDGRRFYYRVPGLTPSKIDTLGHLDVPFTVDLDMVARIDSAMRGQKYFIRTPAWYRASSRDLTSGLRHIEVRVDSVGPGNENFIAAVYFSVVDPRGLTGNPKADGEEYMVYMSIGAGPAATRNFDTLFSFGDPRRAYPEIQDDVWQLIIRSRVRSGMSRDEVRLALGAPESVERVPTYGGMVERWSYSDGVYLIFEDGFVTSFRQ